MWKHDKFTGRWMLEVNSKNRLFAEITLTINSSKYITAEAYIEHETDAEFTTVNSLGYYDISVKECDLIEHGILIPISIDHKSKTLYCKIEKS